jgi:membrane carboxypeptidase/penicillin-binding protein PbpC
MHGSVTLRPRAQETPRRVLDARASFIVGDILSDRAARSLTFGLRNELATSFWSAVKTGTSKDMRDNWCVGFRTATRWASGSAISTAADVGRVRRLRVRRRSGAT